MVILNFKYNINDKIVSLEIDKDFYVLLDETSVRIVNLKTVTKTRNCVHLKIKF